MRKKKILKNWKNRFTYYFIELCALTLCCVFSTYKLSSQIAAIVFALYVIVIAIEKPRIILKYMYIFFMMIANVLGCYICEFGNFFLVELSTYTHYVGALPTLVFSQMVLFSCIYEAEIRYESKQIKRYNAFISSNANKVNERTLCVLNIFVILLYTLLFVHVLPYSALRLNIDRMTFSNMGYNSGIWGSLSKYAQFFIAIPIGCITYTRRKSYKLFGAITIIVYCMYYLWIGNKFGSFFSLFCISGMLMFSRLEIRDQTLRKTFLTVIVVMFALVLGAAFIFTKFQNQGTGINVYLQNRLAEQGQLFWKTYEESAGRLHLSEIGKEISEQMGAPNNAEQLVGAKFGIYNIMYLCAPKIKVDNFILYGSRYTEAGYASAFYYLGINGCICFAFFISQLFVFFTNAIISSTRKSSILGMILMIRMYLITCTFWQLFLFGDFLTGTSIITYIWILFRKKKSIFTLKSGNKRIASFRI